MAIVCCERKVYYSPRRRRYFLTKRAAAMAEATGRILHFWPTEKGESDNIGVTDPGWHFTQVPELVALRQKLFQHYMRNMK